jgi:hypothetical protein
MQEIFDRILAPYMSSMPEFIVSVVGLIGTLACIIPENSKLGRLLGKITGPLSKFRNYLLKRIKK